MEIKNTSERSLKERRYETFFEHTPVSLWEEDLSEVKREIERLKSQGIADLRKYLDENPHETSRIGRMVKILDVNNTTLETYGAKNKEEFFGNLERFYCDESYSSVKEALVACSENKTSFGCEVINKTLSGTKIDAFLKWIVMPGYEESWSSVLISLVDISSRKKAEKEILDLNMNLETIIEDRTSQLKDAMKAYETEIKARKRAEVEILRLNTELEEKVEERTEELERINWMLMNEINERKWKEKELRAREEQYKRLFEESPTPLWEADLSEIKKFFDSLAVDGVSDIWNYLNNRKEIILGFADKIRLINVNKKTLELFKAKTKEDIEKNLNYIFQEQYYESLIKGLIVLFDGASLFECENVNKTLEGDKIHVISRWSLLNGHEKTWSRVIGFIYDITKQKLMDDILKIQRDLGISLSSTDNLEDALKVILDTALKFEEIDCAGIYLLDDKTGNYKLVIHRGISDGFLRDKRIYSPDSSNIQLLNERKPLYFSSSQISNEMASGFESEGIKSIAVIPIEYQQNIIATFNIASRCAEEIPLDIRMILENIASRIGGVITRLKIEEALRESEDQYRVVVSSLPDYVMIYKDEKIIHGNRSLLERMGYELSEIIDRSPLDFADKYSRNNVLRMMKKRMAGEPVDDYEIEIVTKSGEKLSVIVRGVNINFVKENAVMIVLTDITERKKAEEALLESEESLKLKNEALIAIQDELAGMNKQLEEKVAKRTIEVESFLRQKDEFITQLGHDLRTPLTPLISLLPMLLNNEKDPKRINILSIAIENAQYIKHLIEKTLVLAKMNMPGHALETAFIDLGMLVDNLIDSINQAEEYKDVQVINRIPAKIFVDIDEIRIREVFENIIINAIKHGRSESSIEINFEKTGDHVTVSISDNGIGMTPYQIMRAFDEFYKADESRHDSTSVGLGLTICKRIIEKHGGRIWAESDGIGRGTTIIFTLPSVQILDE